MKTHYSGVDDSRADDAARLAGGDEQVRCDVRPDTRIRFRASSGQYYFVTAWVPIAVAS